MTRTALRICPLCEATCGLSLTIDEADPVAHITAARGDADDVFLDAKRERVYVSCGEGFLAILQRNGSTYEELTRVPTVSGAALPYSFPSWTACSWPSARAGPSRRRSGSSARHPEGRYIFWPRLYGSCSRPCAVDGRLCASFRGDPIDGGAMDVEDVLVTLTAARLHRWLSDRASRCLVGEPVAEPPLHRRQQAYSIRRRLHVPGHQRRPLDGWCCADGGIRARPLYCRDVRLCAPASLDACPCCP